MNDAQSPWTQKEVQTKAGSILSQLLAADRKARSRFAKEGREIARYGYAPDFGFEYQTLPRGAFFKAKVALTAETIRVFGPYLYQQNPHRTASAVAWADEFTSDTTALMQDYLNYSVNEYDYYEGSRRCIDESISWGRAILLTRRHPKKPQIVASQYVSVRDFFVDGGALTWPTITRQTIRIVRPRAELLAEYPEAEQTIRSMPKAKRGDKDDCQLDWEQQIPDIADCVEYFQTWSTVGLQRYEGGKELANLLMKLSGEAPDSPLTYCFTVDGKFIHASEWEIPFYIDGDWPITPLDYYDHPDGIWPVSPLATAIGYQRAINWMVTLTMGKARFTMRTLLALVSSNGNGLGEEEKDKVLVGNDAEALTLNINGAAENADIRKYIQQFDWNNDWMNSAIKFIELMQQLYDNATGKYAILYSGQTQTQVRNASTAQMMDRNSQSRINDMRDRVVRWQSLVARKEAMGARFLLTRKDIGKIMGPDAAQRWGFLIKPEQTDINAFIQKFAASGIPLDQATMMARERMEQAVDLERWARETDYSIEADSLKKRDIDAQITGLGELMNQAVPTMLGSMDPADRAMGFQTMAQYHQAIGTPLDVVNMFRQRAQQLLTMPPPPPPGSEPVGVPPTAEQGIS